MDVKGKITFEWVTETGFEVVDWIHLRIVFWVITQGTAIDVFRRFGDTLYLYLQSERIRFQLMLK